MSQSRPTIFEVILKDVNLLNKANKDGCENLKRMKSSFKV